MKRREFLNIIAGRFPAAVGLLVFFHGCGSSDTPAPAATAPDTTTPAGSCEANGTSTSIAGNHGHSITVSAAEVAAAVDVVYDISSSAGHGHSVTVTASQFATLQAGTSISVTSTSNGHTHLVTVGCL